MGTQGSVWLVLGWVAVSLGQAAETAPSFQEVRALLKANLVDVDDTRLDRAATEGLLRELAPFAVLLTNGVAVGGGPDKPVLAKTSVFDGGFGYLRVGRVGQPLAEELGDALEAMARTNKVKGWVLDLRFAGGADYAAAAAVADRFVAKEQPLLDHGQGVVRAKPKERPISAPVLVLVNRHTAEAAEALAAILRKTDSALLLGTNTAGRGFVTRLFPLQNGQQLRIATALVKVGGSEPLSRQGVKPDILVAVSPEDERAYLEDPFRPLSKPALAATRGGGDTNLLAALTNRSLRPRVNEAELNRMLREGGEYDPESALGRLTEASVPTVRDPALARALDLLKGLSVVRREAVK